MMGLSTKSHENRICQMLEEVSKLVDSPRNRELQALYEPPPVEVPFGPRQVIPKPHGGNLQSVPCQCYLSFSLWSRILEFDLLEFFTYPEIYIENYLRIWKYQFCKIQDDTPLYKIIPIWLGLGFEASWYGLPVVKIQGQMPWESKEPLLNRPGDIEQLGEPDFYKSGVMPFALRFYERAKELVEPYGFTVAFPLWFRGPFVIALHLRGVENFLMDMLLDPEGSHRLLRYLTDHHKSWFITRAVYLGRTIEKLLYLANDEVDAQMISPHLYKEYIFPYENELCLFHGGYRYWHSCGNITPFLMQIRQLPAIDMLHKSAATDLKQTASIFSGTPLEVCLNPISDVQMASPKDMQDKIIDVFKTAKESNLSAFAINNGPLDVFHDPKQDLAQAEIWVKVSRETREDLSKRM